MAENEWAALGVAGRFGCTGTKSINEAAKTLKIWYDGSGRIASWSVPDAGCEE
jgi:hypothetical protein